MGKATCKQVFKQYHQQQTLLLPPSLEELIAPNHLVRVVNDVVDQLNIDDILAGYTGGGTSAYHPKMMIKVLLYAYSVKIYTGRRIAKALQQDVTFMWLAAFNRPDFRTINNFRSGVLKQTIEQLFASMLDFLIDRRYIRFEHYFCDGSTFEADANRHKVIWKKNAGRYQQAAEQHCRDLFNKIDQLNQEEQRDYANKNLEECGEHIAPVSDQDIVEQTQKLDQIIANGKTQRQKRKAITLKKKLQVQRANIEKYKQQQQISGRRSGYSATDQDATGMRMKNGEVLPGYNVLIGSEDQFITGYSIHQKNNDGACFKDHMDQLSAHGGHEPASVVADSIFGTQENYQLLEQKEIAAYVQFPLYQKEKGRKYRNNPYLKENFHYQPSSDTYQCPNNKLLHFRGVKTERNRNGYIGFNRVYECENCDQCPLAQACKGSSKSARTIRINTTLDQYKQQARNNLSSPEGDYLRRMRGTEVETCFGDIKRNQGFRRFHLRGKSKVKTEFGLISLAHNLRKIYLISAKTA